MKIDYILSNYPAKPTVFIYREIKELIRNGHTVRIISLTPKILNRSNSHSVILENSEVIYPSSNPFAYIISTLYGLFSGKTVLYSLEHYRASLKLLSKKNIFKIVFNSLVIDNLVFKLKRNQSAVTHIHTHHLFLSTYTAYEIAKRINTTFSITLHTLSHFYPQSTLKNILKRAIFLRTISSELAPFYNGVIQDLSKFHYISNGINSHEFILNPSFKINEEIQIIAVGALLDKKGFDTLIFSCAILKDYGLRFKCKIYGEGPEKKLLKSLIKSLKLEDNVELIDWAENPIILKHISDADILVMPSRPPSRSTRDGLPTVIIEAMASGTIVIGSDFAGIPDIIKHKETGLLVTPESDKEIANSIIEIYFDNTLRELLITNALKKVRTEYSLEPNISKLQKLFKSSIFPN